MKILIITFLFLYIKVITTILLILFILVYKESNNILKKEDNNFCIVMKSMYITPNEYPIIRMISYSIEKKIFDLTYIRIIMKEKNLIKEILKTIKIKNLIKMIFFYYMGINRLLFKMIKEVILYKEENLNSYLFKIIQNPFEDRIIIKIDGVWKVNGKEKEIADKDLINMWKNFSHNQCESLRPWLTNVIKRTNEKLIKKNKIYIKYGFFLNNKTPHMYFLNINKNPKKEIIMGTDFDKTEINNNYSKPEAINKVFIKKETRLLVEPIEKIKLKGREDEISAIYLAKEAYYNGFNEEFLNDLFLDNVDIVKDLDKILGEELAYLFEQDKLKEVKYLIIKEMIKIKE